MKKILCIIFIFALTLSMFACGKDVEGTLDNNEEDDNPIAPVIKTETVFKYNEWDTEGYHVFVSTKGNDKNDGLTKDTPVATIYKANAIAKKYIDTLTSGMTQVVIAVEAGNYYVSETVQLLSGNDYATVNYVSYGGFATFVGAVNVLADNIKLCDDEKILSKIKNSEVKKSLYEIDISEFRDILTTLRVKTKAASPKSVIQFYREDTTLEPARWPNGNEICDDAKDFGYNTRGYTLTNYINYTKDGKFYTPNEINTIGGKMELPLNVFLCDNTYDRVFSWDVDNEDIYVIDFFGNNWDDSIHKVVSFTDFYKDNGTTIKMPNNVSYKGYFTTEDGREYNNEMDIADGEGNSDFRRWYFFNVLEEIDYPGEYYYDMDNCKVYLYTGEDEAPDDFFIATQDDVLFEIKGTESNPAKNLNVRNLAIKYSQYTLVHIAYADGVTFTGCDMGHNSTLSFDIEFTKNLTVKDTRILKTGCGSVKITNCQSPKSAIPIGNANILFDNCEIGFPCTEHISYAMCFNISTSTGITIQNCDLHDGGHGAITYGTICSLLVKNNHVYNFERDTDDVGLFYNVEDCYMYDVVFDGNVIHNIGSDWQPWHTGIWYTDGDSHGYVIKNNVVYDINPGATFSPCSVLGKMKGGLAYNNLFFNTSPETEIANPTSTDTIAKWWRDTYSKEMKNSKDRWSDVAAATANGRFDFLNDLSDEDSAYVYNFVSYMRSDMFYDIFSNALAVWDTVSNGYDVNSNGAVRITDSTVAQFTITTKTKTYKGGTDFKSASEMFKILFDLNYDCKGGTMPSGVTVKYKNTKVKAAYMNMYDYDAGLKKYVPTYAAVKSGVVSDEGVINYSKFIGDNSSYGAKMTLLYFGSEYGYLGKYHTNITINNGLDFSSSKSDFNCNFIDVKNSLDVDEVEFDCIDENGNYTSDFLDFVENAVSNNLIENFSILDLSKVGAANLYEERPVFD